MTARHRRLIAEVAIGVFLFLVTIVALSSWCLQTKWFWSKFLPDLLNYRFKDVKIIALDVAIDRWQSPERVDLKGFLGRFRFGEKEHLVRCDRVRVESEWAKIGLPEDVWLGVERCDVDGVDWALKGIRLKLSASFKENKLWRARGRLKVNELSSGDYVLMEVTGDLKTDGRDITLENLDARVADGRMSGTVKSTISEAFPVRVVLDLEKVNVDKLSRDKKSFLSEIHGVIDGRIEVTGDRQGIHSFNSSLSMADGGQIKAAWLRFLLERLPGNSAQYKDFSELVKMNGDVFFEKFTVTTESLSEEKLVANLNMESRRFNLKLNNRVDINMEGGLFGLLKYFEHFSN